ARWTSADSCRCAGAAFPGGSLKASNIDCAGAPASSIPANSISLRLRLIAPPAAGKRRLSLVQTAHTPLAVDANWSGPSGRVLELGSGAAGRQWSPSYAVRKISQRPLLAQ